MAKVGVSLKINCSQIDKARLFAGQKGQYLDATVFIDLDQLDQYGNSGMITQDVTKEEKAQQVKGNILGNCKVFWSDTAQAPQAQAPQGGYQQAPQQQKPQQPATNSFAQNHPQQQPQGHPQQRAPSGSIDFDDDLPF